MTFRSELRAAVDKAGALSYADIEKMFPGRSVATPLSQMTTAKQFKRDGKGKDAIYTIGSKGEVKVSAGRGKRTATKGRRSASKKRSAGNRAQQIGRGGPIAATIAELLRRRDGIDSAIAVLENLGS